MVARAPWVASVAATMSSPQSKLSATSAEPRLVVERIWVTPGISRSAISAGRVMSARHLRCVALARVDRHDNARIIDMREQGDRQAGRRDQARQGDQEDAEPDRPAMALQDLLTAPSPRPR